MAVSSPCPLLSVTCWSREISDELFRMIWSAAIHFIHHLEMTIGCQPLCGSIYMWTYLPVFPPLPWRSRISTFWLNTYILELAAANVTSYHRCWMDYDMIFFGGYWRCMHCAWGISVNYYNYYVYLLRSLPTATSINCCIRRFLSVLWWTRYPAALCCLCARWNQSSDAQ